ncbi:tRNA (adenosine(37)-N6)-threonylcarbamoyltransferase complex ATPase subunit type 1 TsaE [Candidatus Pelagibacter sp.]|nr:tRNA (adenosine(37)-N6)-threonylcarbamoyltransferase complex ATPase subunit type 1 TsaE [Candidatus Pelagibacter sp.]
MPIAIKNSKIDISSEESTKKLAKKFKNYLKVGDVVFLYGEIGVGKTTFVRHLINEFQKSQNLSLEQVTSPTFNLLNEYKLTNFIIKHYDLFRINNVSELENLGLFENNEDIITLVEWPELIDPNMLKNRINITFNYENDLKNRSVMINGIN